MTKKPYCCRTSNNTLTMIEECNMRPLMDMSSELVRVFKQVGILISGVLVALCLHSSVLQAQIGGGSIVGVVTDPMGLAIAGAKVEATNVETGETTGVTTNAEGYYEFPLLRFGRYILST